MKEDNAELLERALEIALREHRRQKDKAGAPYILHPIRLMMRLSDDTERIVALLHDVVEDGGLTFNDLRDRGFPERVLGPLRLVTKLPEEHGSDEGYAAFITRLQADPVARRVKMADLQDNMDLTRFRQPTDQDRLRAAKYERAYKQLEATEAHARLRRPTVPE